MDAKVTNEKSESLDVKYSFANVHIVDSATIPKEKIADWVKIIKSFGEQNGYEYSRSLKSWINEWRAHNLLFKWGIAPHRTKDVDLNEDESSTRKLGYLLLSLLYI